jgi:hypothetical protein
MDVDLKSQPLDLSQQGELVRLYVDLYSAYWDDKADVPWWLMPKTEMKRRSLGKRVDVLVKDMICAKQRLGTQANW